MTDNSTQPAPPDMTELAMSCAAILKKQQAVIKEAQDLMMAQRMTREQVMSINPFQWLSEVVHEWALTQLEPAQPGPAAGLQNVIELPPAKVDPANN